MSKQKLRDLIVQLYAARFTAAADSLIDDYWKCETERDYARLWEQASPMKESLESIL